MARYNRINLDGKSTNRTFNGILTNVGESGGFAVLSNGDFSTYRGAVAGEARPPLYVLEAPHNQNISDSILAGQTVVGHLVEDGRELAILCPPGSYGMNDQIAINDSGQVVRLNPTTPSGPYIVIGFVTDIDGSSGDLVITDNDELVRVRIQAEYLYIPV